MRSFIQSILQGNYLNDPAAVEAFPKRIAISDDRGNITYSSLASEVRSVRDVLKRNSEKASIIAIHGHINREFLVLLFAVWSAGHVVVPVDDRLPSLRKNDLVACGWIDLIIDLSLMPIQPPPHKPVWRVSEGNTPPDFTSYLSTDVSTNAAYITFTSGTTGYPKAFLGRATSLLNFIQWQAEHFGFEANDRVPVLSGPSFDPYMREVLTVLSVGGTLVIPSLSARNNSDILIKELYESQITRLHAVPALATHWARALDRSSSKLDYLRTVFFAGEPLSSSLVSHWRLLAPGAQIVNLYGPSETTLAKFYNIVENDLPITRNLPVGIPLPGTRAVILNPKGEPNQDGISGDIFIDTEYATLGTVENGWQGLARESKLARFSPYLYPTGDLGVISNGKLQVLGRADGHCKISGVKFHPAEVAEALKRVEGVSEAFVIPKKSNSGGVLLYAVYVPTQKHTSDNISRIRRELSKIIPSPLVPSRIVPVEEIPVTVNGKVDVVAALDRVMLYSEHDLARGTEETQKAIVHILKTILEREEILSTDNFFELGGDSVVAIEVAARLEQDLRRPCMPEDIFLYPTIANLATVLDKRPEVRDLSDTIALERADSTSAPFTLSKRQRAYQAVCMADGDHDWCILSRVISGIGRITPSDIRTAIERISSDHDILRYRLSSVNYVDFQQTVPVNSEYLRSVEISEFDLTESDREYVDNKISMIRAEGSKKLFDLGKAPLLRFAIIDDAPNNYLVVWSHHLILDGPSLNVFCQYLRSAFSGEYNEKPKPAASYAEFARKDALATDSSATNSRDYWISLLRAPTPVRFPEMIADGGGDEGYIYTKALPFDLVNSIREKSREWQCTPFVILLGAYVRTIGLLTNNPSPPVIVPMQAKPGARFANTLGLFFTMGIVRVKTKSICSDGVFTHTVRDQIANSLKHADFEFHERMDALGLNHRDRYFPISTALFNQNRLDSGMSYDAATPVGLHALGRSLRYQIQGEVQVKDRDFRISYLFKRSVFFGEGGIDVFAESVEKNIGEIIS